MSANLQNYLVICDLDQTLLAPDGEVPECDKTVIRLFTELGGHFSVMTERPPQVAQVALGDLAGAVPVIGCGGALLYDLAQKKVVHCVPLDRLQAAAAITDILAKFPSLGAEIETGTGERHVIRANSLTYARQKAHKVDTVDCPLECVPDGWIRAAIVGQPEDMERMQEYLPKKYYGSENQMVMSAPTALTFLHTEAGYAHEVQQLCANVNIPLQKTIVVGGCDLDVQAMEIVGHAVAVAGASPKARAAADESTVCRSQDGAVGEFLYQLISRVCGRT